MRAFKANLAVLAGAAMLAFWTNTTPAQQIQQAAATAKAAAVVNGEPISAAEIDHITALMIKDRFKLQPPTDQQRAEVRMEVVMSAIEEALMRQFLAKSGVQMDPADVEKHMAELATNLKNAQPSRTLQDFCRETGHTEAQIRASVTTMLRWGNYVKTRINEADVRKYYGENKEFFDQVQVRASHILVRLAPNASEAERQAAVQKLQALRTELASGKLDFAEAAKKHSQCPTGSGGGDLGFFSRKWMLPEPFAKAAFALPIGGLSEVVPTELGVHLIKVTERKNGEASDFEKIKEDVRDYYVEELRQNILVQERKAAKIDLGP